MALAPLSPRPGAPPLAADAVVFGEALVEPVSRDPRCASRRRRALCPSSRRCALQLRDRSATPGGPTALVTQVGPDAFGCFIKKRLTAEGVAIDGISSHKTARTGVTFVSVAHDGERSFLFYRHPSADMLITPAEVPPPLINRGRLFHFGSSSLSREPSRAATLHAIEVARKQRERRLVSCDLNLRPHLWPEIKEAPPLLRKVLAGCDVVKLTDDELPLLCGTESIEAGAAMVRSLGAQVVVVTMGERGAYLDAPQGTAYFAAEPVAVVDRTGAGDAFLRVLSRRCWSVCPDRGQRIYASDCVSCQWKRSSGRAATAVTWQVGSVRRSAPPPHSRVHPLPRRYPRSRRP